VPTSLEKVSVTPQPLTVALTSNFTGVQPSYLTGDYVRVTIDARDQFNNYIGSKGDNFVLSLNGQTTNSNYGPSVAVSDGQGSYTAGF
jgi:hypothetical protein